MENNTIVLIFIISVGISTIIQPLIKKKVKKEKKENKMDLKERIEWLARELEKTKELLEEQEEIEKNFPQDGDSFYFIDEDGYVIFATFDADYIENERMKNIGNCFKTLEKADFEVERRKVIKELKEYSRPFIIGEKNYYLTWQHEKYWEPAYVKIPWASREQTNNFYFESEEKAEEAMKAVGEDRIKKYYLGIEANNGY